MRRLLAACLAVVLGIAAVPAGAAEPTIWFAPEFPFPGWTIGSRDYMDLFSPGALWTQAASHVQVFKLYPQIVANASDADLSRIIAGVAQRHMALAMEIGALVVHDGCGNGLEGYGAEGNAALAARLKRLGADLRFIAMDGPLTAGHDYDAPGGCHDSIAAVARTAATTFATFRAVFPAIQAGDIEAVGNIAHPDWPQQIADWLDAFREAAGEKLAFLDIDENWAGPWLPITVATAAIVRRAGVPFGIIYNDAASGISDREWIARTQAHYEEYESDDRAPPDIAVFQSWTHNPTRVLPETDPGAFTYLIDSYFRPRTRLELHVTETAPLGATATGRLVDAAGAGIADAAITVEAVPVTGAGRLTARTLDGQVPDASRTALFMLCIDAGCGTAQGADIELGRLSYREMPSGRDAAFTFADGLSGWQTLQNNGTITFDQRRTFDEPGPEGRLLHARTQPGQTIKLNGPRFAVTAGARFTAQMMLRVPPASAGTGYVAVIFLDAAGRELARALLPLRPAAVQVMAQTSADGRFSATLPPDDFRDAGFRAIFTGDAERRGSRADAR